MRLALAWTIQRSKERNCRSRSWIAEGAVSRRELALIVNCSGVSVMENTVSNVDAQIIDYQVVAAVQPGLMQYTEVA